MVSAAQISPSKPSADRAEGRRAASMGWYVAYVRPNCERRVAADIARAGYETYVATQKVWRQWSDRRKLIDKVVITQIIFIRCTLRDTERLERLSIIYHFLRIPGTRTKATIPDEQLANFRAVLTRADEENVLFTSDKFSKGDPVRIRFGKFAGVTGIVEREANGAKYLTVVIDYLGSARVKIKAEDLMPLADGEEE